MSSTDQQEPTLYSVKAIILLDNDGNRLIAKYYDAQFPSSKEQKTFEKNLFSKTHKANAEIIMFEGLTCVYRSNVDLFFYVVGSAHENELILASVLNCFYDTVSQILRKNVEKRTLLENLDFVFLALDEICDGGIILDFDSSSIVLKAAIRTDDIPIGEQTVTQPLPVLTIDGELAKKHMPYLRKCMEDDVLAASIPPTCPTYNAYWRMRSYRLQKNRSNGRF